MVHKAVSRVQIFICLIAVHAHNALPLWLYIVTKLIILLLAEHVINTKHTSIQHRFQFIFIFPSTVRAHFFMLILVHNYDSHAQRTRSLVKRTLVRLLCNVKVSRELCFAYFYLRQTNYQKFCRKCHQVKSIHRLTTAHDIPLLNSHT